MMEKIFEDENDNKSFAELINCGWLVSSSGKEIKKEFKFDNFVEAFGFMTKIALMAEKINHHPEWKNTYNRIFFFFSLTSIIQKCKQWNHYY